MKYWKWYTYGFLSLILVFAVIFSTPTPSYAGTGYQIEVNKTTNKLYLYYNGSVIKTYPVATGRTKKLTPEGIFRIGFKAVKPGWTKNGKTIPGGSPQNPLGERWLGLRVNGDNARIYGIHGTNNPSSIGKHVSNGCIRMYNKNVIELYNRVPLNTQVWIHSGVSNGHWLGKQKPIKRGPGKVKVMISSGYLNLRMAPSTKARVLTRVKRGTILNKVTVTGDWVKVRVGDGKIAYVYKKYVRDI
jgi:hypothetical protein